MYCVENRQISNAYFILYNYIDSIEANVDNAAVHVEDANVQLQKASHYQVWSYHEFVDLVSIQYITLKTID